MKYSNKPRHFAPRAKSGMTNKNAPGGRVKHPTTRKVFNPFKMIADLMLRRGIMKAARRRGEDVSRGGDR